MNHFWISKNHQPLNLQSQQHEVLNTLPEQLAYNEQAKFDGHIINLIGTFLGKSLISSGTLLG